ncbi:hypothetical protein JYT31_00150 [Beggiatoa alba]|nr:hypothetical protein [Beggiatoa alba]
MGQPFSRSSEVVFATILFFSISNSWAHKPIFDNGRAHDPIFAQGTHVLSKNGFEIATELHSSKQGDELENEIGLELKYGITGNWEIGMEIPYVIKADNGASSSGSGDISLSTKYRFWRKNTLALQESAAISLKLIGQTGDENQSPELGSGTTDSIVGLSYGYEARTWYRWASIRHQQNGINNSGLQRGDKTLVDFVIGMRPTLTGYTEPQTIWLLELNGELGDQSKLNGNRVVNTGGNEWFISPGIFWTIRNFGIKAGIQLPIANDLNGAQEKSDYRANLTFEWHS